MVVNMQTRKGWERSKQQYLEKVYYVYTTILLGICEYCVAFQHPLVLTGDELKLWEKNLLCNVTNCGDTPDVCKEHDFTILEHKIDAPKIRNMQKN